MSMISVSRQPTVVLAGWLGCKRRSLRRYETMYKDMGWNVIVQIASPLMVVKAATGLKQEKRASLSPRRTNNITKESNCIRELALDTLDQVQKSQCTGFVFHAFSNGGAFLWEEVRDIVKRSGRSSANGNNLSGEYCWAKNKLAGLVFDSAPAFYGEQDTILKALSYATLEEQNEGKAWIQKSTYEMGDAAFFESKRRRAHQYWQGMLDDDTNVPHLYLYSKTDPLTSHEKVHELINHRRSRFGDQSASALCFDDSPHCCHFLKHPQQYQTTLERFLTTKCLLGTRCKL